MYEDILKAAILGVVQGLTEFLPVSSTGHLIIAHKVLGVDDERFGLTFDAALHLGTLAALLLFFGRRWFSLAHCGVRAAMHPSKACAEGRLAWLIVLATIPAAVLGFFFEQQIENALRSPVIVAITLIAFSAVFLLAERAGQRARNVGHLNWVDAVIVGFAQAAALVPGVSRSGATISAGLFRNIDRRSAAEFAFLMSAPIIAGAGAKKVVDLAQDVSAGRMGGEEVVFFATGLAVAGVVGYAAIAFLLRFLASNSLAPFAAYRVLVGVSVLSVVGLQAL